MTNTPPRLAQIDGLRGIAALMVVIFHYTTVYPRFVADALPAPFDFEIGSFGVHLFFIISGFVILMTLERRGAGIGFVYSRFVRLYPVFWASVLLTSLVLSLSSVNGLSAPGVLPIAVNMTMAQDYLKISAVDGVYWSLTYELGFYFLMFWVFRLSLQRHIELIAGLWILGSATFALIGPVIPHPLHLVLVINSYGHLFAAGLLLYRVWQYGWSAQRAALLVAATAVTLAPTLDAGTSRGLMPTVIIAGLVLVMGVALFTPWLRFLSAPPLTFLGRISYPLYLTHQMIGYVLLAKLQGAGAGWWTSVLVTMAMAILLAIALTLFVDEPARRFLIRWRPEN